MAQGKLIGMALKLQEHVPLRIVEWLVAGFLVSWGLAALAIEETIWQLPVNRELANLGSKDLWGCFALSLGAIRFAALFVNGAVQRSPHARALGAFMSIFLWTQLTLGVITGGMETISVVVYPWVLLADLYNVYRASQDARFSDKKAKAMQGRPDASSA